MVARSHSAITSNLLPPLSSSSTVEDDLTENGSLKSDGDATSWAFRALYKSVMFLCQPWDAEESASYPGYYVTSDSINGDEDDVVSVQESIGSNKTASDDTKSQRSLDINLDYMAYVKKTESLHVLKMHNDEINQVDSCLHQLVWIGSVSLFIVTYLVQDHLISLNHFFFFSNQSHVI